MRRHVRPISYGVWRRDLDQRGWLDWRYWAVFVPAATVSLMLGGWWPLVVTPAVFVADYAWTSSRISALPPPPLAAPPLGR